MDKIIIKRTGQEFITQFAAPSILTGTGKESGAHISMPPGSMKA